MADDTKENDLPLVSNVNDILVNHYIFNFSCSFEEKCFNCCIVLFLSPVMNCNLENETNSCGCGSYSSSANNCDKPSTSVVCVDMKENRSDCQNFMLILDCHQIIVEDVEEINLSEGEQENFKYVNYNTALFPSASKLNFAVDRWSLKIWKNCKSCKFCFPKCLRISYKTLPEGPSLLWVTDQDKK